MPGKKRWHGLWCAAVVGIAWAGCGRSAPGPPVPVRPGAAAEARVIDEHELAERLAAHRGQVVLVDFWATWCGPCVELFPHTVDLARRLADQGLAVVGVSLDDPDDLPAVQEFLAAQGAAFENYVSRYGVGSRSIQAFEIRNGALPLVKLYDRQGRLYATFGGGEPLSPREIDRAVAELLSQSK